MTPVNTKSLLAFIFGQMEALANKQIDNSTAMAQAKLAAQACNVLNYELKRTMVQLKMRGLGYKSDIHIREIESKDFDNTMKYNPEYKPIEKP